MQNNIFLGLVPHAGKDYAGRARKSVFDSLKKKIDEKQDLTIYYLATIHKRLTPKEEQYSYAYMDVTHVTNVSNMIHWPSGTLSNPSFYADAISQEHSYEWVKQELKDAFKNYNANYIVIFPHENDIEIWYDWLTREIAHGNVLILATTDLIHHGKEYGTIKDTTFNFPQQIDKIRYEEPLIQSLIDNNIELLQHTLHTTPFVADSPYVLRLLTRITSTLKNLRGRVVDYYDSSDANSGNILDLYTISRKPVDTFVSYVGIVWVPVPHETSILVKFDIMQALGALRSIISFNGISRLTDSILFPSWSTWRRHEFDKYGVFVGTEVLGQGTNCSYGQFPTDESLPRKITFASQQCPKDAADRWHIPYTLLNFENLKFKIELLAPYDSWKWIKSPYILKFVEDMFQNEDYNVGIQLIIPSIGSATYLPIVAKEWKNGNPREMAESYLSSLSRKLGGTSIDWKREGTIAGIYHTVAFYS